MEIEIKFFWFFVDHINVYVFEVYSVIGVKHHPSIVDICFSDHVTLDTFFGKTMHSSHGDFFKTQDVCKRLTHITTFTF